MSILTSRKTAALLLALCLSGASSVGWAQNFDVGADKYDKKDYAGALREWQPLANRGDADAQYGLGWMYENGRGVKQDDAQAVAWFRKAAEQGLAAAQFDLGLMYYAGKSVKQDYAQAAAWYRKAADQGHEQAKTLLVRLQGKAAQPAARPGSEAAHTQHPELVQLILTTASMDAQEKRQWIGLLPTMTPQQRAKLTEVLETEKRKLEELDRKYQQDIKALNEKYAK